MEQNNEKQEEKQEAEQPKEERKLSMVESAHEAAERLKEQNQIMEKNIKRLEELKSIEVLGGASEGSPQPKQPQEVDPKDYAASLLKNKMPSKE